MVNIFDCFFVFGGYCYIIFLFYIKRVCSSENIFMPSLCNLLHKFSQIKKLSPATVLSVAGDSLLPLK